jgi:hypothetical protein
MPPPHDLEDVIDALVKRDGDHCSVCRTEFRHNAATFYGCTSDGAAAVVGECCRHRLQSITHAGVYLQGRMAGADIAKRAGISRHPYIMHVAGCEPWKEDDDAWFETHPNRLHRLRPLLPEEAESWGGPPAVTPPPRHEYQVIVRQVAPRARVRLLFCRNLDVSVPDNESILHAIFDLHANCSEADAGRKVSVREIAALAVKYAGARS